MTGPRRQWLEWMREQQASKWSGQSESHPDTRSTSFVEIVGEPDAGGSRPRPKATSTRGIRSSPRE